MNFSQKLDAIIQKSSSLVCVGLDSDINKLPEQFKNSEHPQFEFNKAIIDATHDLVCAYKPNSAFYEARGDRGVLELKMTFDYINQTCPEVVTILDAKRADIGNTNNGYVTFAFEYLKADAITLHPYLGSEAIKAFLGRADKGAIILCRTSNSGAGELQDLPIVISNEVRNPQGISSAGTDLQSVPQQFEAGYKPAPATGLTLYQHIAHKAATDWNKNNNVLLVVGATYPEELAQIRQITGDMTFLVPGVGAQGGDVEKTIKAGLNSKKAGMIVNSSRGVIFASQGTDFAQKAREETQKLQEEINKFR